MRANLTGRDNRLSKLEENLAVMRSSLRKTQDECARLSSAQRRVSSMIDQHKKSVSNLNLNYSSTDLGSPRSNHTAREREVIKKGIERMEK